MPKRRRAAIDDNSDESEDLSDTNSVANIKSEEDSSGESDVADTVRSRNRKRRLAATKSIKQEDDNSNEGDDLHWPVVLKTNGQQKNGKRTSTDDGEDDEPYTESNSDASEVASDNSSDNDDEFEFSDGGFVVDSDDNVVPSRGGSSQSRKRGRRRAARTTTRRGRRQRRSRKRKGDSDEDEIESDDEFSGSEGSIAEELRELKDQNSPTRRNRNYRARPPVNYAIPPPPTIEEVAKATAQAAEASAKAKTTNSRVRRLFDVRGPFGGNDVHSIFNLSRQDLENVVKNSNISPGHASSSLDGSISGDVRPNGTSMGKNGGNADVDPVDVAGDVDFSMVGGLDSYIGKLKEMVSLPLLYPELYEKFGITPPRGVLFHGPPGTGKTLMARALAASHKQEKVTFYMRKGADVLSKWIGESERQLRALFDEARAHQPSIIFFDEIDGLAPVRSARQEQHHASIVSTLLALMDGMDNRGQVVVIGATNRPDSVDPALRRPGRFDREFYFPLPDMEARQRILEIHTRKWDPPLCKELLISISKKTKGFGGADLRALTTEAALLAIRRAYPQIYGSVAKLAVDSSKISVRPQDFALALERIQPSTARAAGNSLAQPLPSRVEPLLRTTFDQVTHKVRTIFPSNSSESEKAALFLNEEQFLQAQEVKAFSQSRIHRPKLLLLGSGGNGQGYLLRAVANMLEGVYVSEISTSSVFGSTAGAIQPESAIVNAVAEARQRAPACILLPSLNEWKNSAHLESLLVGLLQGLLPSEKVFVVGVDDSAEKGFRNRGASSLCSFFGSDNINIKLDTSAPVLLKFFEPVFDFIKRTPLQCREAQELPRADPPKLKEVNNPPTLSGGNSQVSTAEAIPKSSDKRVLTESKRAELKVRSQLKLKLGLILDGFRQRYRRFRKPIIDEQKLVHLFEAPVKNKILVHQQSGLSEAANVSEISDKILENNIDQEMIKSNETEENNNQEEGEEQEEEEEEEEMAENYVLTDDNMILDRTTNKKYHNMDLETVEDRLWNGFYCEPDQFLEDMEMIYKDAVEYGERERMHKASEMLANAQVAIDDISGDKQFIAACQELHWKDAQLRLSEMLNSSKESRKADNCELTSENNQPEKLDDTTSTTEPHDINESPNNHANGIGAENTTSGGHIDEAVLSSNASPAMAHSVYDSADDRKVVYDPQKYELFSQILVKVAENQNLENLEQLFASLSDISWRFREDWDRTAMIQSMSSHLQYLQAEGSMH